MCGRDFSAALGGKLAGNVFGFENRWKRKREKRKEKVRRRCETTSLNSGRIKRTVLEDKSKKEAVMNDLKIERA